MLHYEIIGEGEPLVLLHGFLEDSSMYDGVKAAWSKNQKLILIDLPGHGKSQHIQNWDGMDEMARYVWEVVEHLELNKPHIMGHSLGGYIACQLLEKHSSMISEITLLNSTARADNLQRKKDRDRVIKVVKSNLGILANEAIPNLFYDRFAHEETILNMIHSASQLKPEGVISAIKAMRDREDKTELLKKNRQKVNYIIGKYDNILAFEEMQKEVEFVEPKSVRILETGHVSVIEGELKL
jgi:pimeloyl-ACP methyl ester carboxylesterase